MPCSTFKSSYNFLTCGLTPGASRSELELADGSQSETDGSSRIATGVDRSPAGDPALDVLVDIASASAAQGVRALTGLSKPGDIAASPTGEHTMRKGIAAAPEGDAHADPFCRFLTGNGVVSFG